MKDLNNIEEQFRQQLQQMDVKTTASSEEMWSRIESNLGSKRRLAWYWVAGALVMLVIGFVIGYFLANPTTVAQHYQTSVPDLPNYTTTEQSFGNAQSNQFQHSSDPSTSTDNTSISKEKKSSSISTSTAIMGTPKSNREKAPMQDLSSHPMKMEMKNMNSNEAPKSEKAELTIMVDETAQSKTEELNSEEKLLFQPLLSKGNPPHLAVSTTDRLQPQLRTLADPILNPRFQLGFVYQPQITLLRATENTSYPIQYGNGFSAFILKSKEGYYYSAGLEYNETRYGYRYHSETTGEFTYYNQLLSVTYNDDGTLTNLYGDTTVQSTITTDVAYNNVYKQMGLNFELGKQWALGRSSLLAGIQANLYYVPQQVARYSTSDSYTGVVRAPEKGMKSMIVVPAVTAQWRYQLAPKWNVHAGLRMTVLPSYIWNSESGNTLFRPNLMIGVSRTILR
ncbi:MAG: hypothetical protein RLZZ77_2481 [Bacteroidota bacterium]